MRRVGVLLAVLALLGGGALTALAVNGDGGNTYTACLSRGGGIIKVAIGEAPVTPCRDDQIQISWSDGVSAEEFAELTQRVSDLEASSDASDAYHTWVSGVADPSPVLDQSSPALDLLELDLPQGNYILHVSMQLFPDGLTGAEWLLCHFEDTAAGDDPVNFDTTVGGSNMILSFSHSYSAMEDLTVVLSCERGSGAGGAIVVGHSELLAIPVDSVDNQPTLWGP